MTVGAVLSPGALWIDHLAYSSALLRPGEDVWANTAAFAHYAREAQDLLQSSVIDLRIDAFTESWLRREGATLDLGSDGIDAVEAVMRNPRYVAALHDILAAVADLSQGGEGLTVTLPAADHLAPLIVGSCGRGDAAIEAADLDMAILYLTEALRGLTAFPVRALMFDDARPDIDIYDPLLNVAHDYGWSVGVRKCTSAERFDFVVSDAPPEDGPAWGKWLKDIGPFPTSATETAFIHWTLAAGLPPEAVLSSRRELA